MVSGPVIRFELKDGRIVRKYFYDPKTKKDVELPSDFPIPGWGAYGGCGTELAQGAARQLRQPPGVRERSSRPHAGGASGIPDIVFEVGVGALSTMLRS